MKTAMQQMLDELMAHEYTIPIGLIVKCKELIEVEKEQLKKAYYTDAVSRPLGVFTSLTPVLKTFENYYNETYNK